MVPYYVLVYDFQGFFPSGEMLAAGDVIASGAGRSSVDLFTLFLRCARACVGWPERELNNLTVILCVGGVYLLCPGRVGLHWAFSYYCAYVRCTALYTDRCINFKCFTIV